MSARLARFFVAAVFVSSCVPIYEPPRADQPHAVLKLRRSYEAVAGTSLTEFAKVDGHVALDLRVNAQIAAAPRTDAFLAYPVPADLEVGSEFFHYEWRTVSESYRESKTVYRTESYSCSSGYGPTASHSTCTRTVPHTEYEVKHRQVTKNVAISDGSCRRAIRFAPQDRRVYLLQYTYQAPSACSLSCFEQVQLSDGSFQNSPCREPPPDAPQVVQPH